MIRTIFFLSFFLMSFACAQKKVEDIRILNLLPYVVQPPLVDPFLPEDFTLGEKEGDPYFCGGYYWGNQGALTDYFEDPMTLKGCLIRSQVSETVKQIGLNRFSNDGNTQDLTVAGFTEIKMNKGRWGIFPYRELLAKGPKGRRYYQMWVGLNTDEGATLYFQFIYPDYLNEPTQTQKNIWANFVKRTALLSMSDLLTVRGVSIPAAFQEGGGIEEMIAFAVEKRRSDQKIFIQIDPTRNFLGTFSILGVKDINFLTGLIDGEPRAEIETLIALKEGEEVSEKVSVPYQMVDHFSFESKMLQLSRFEEVDNYLVFH